MAALLLLMTQFSFAQEKLSTTPAETIGRVDPVVYSQPVTDDRTPITEPVQANQDFPQYIQRFSTDRSPLSLQTKIPEPMAERTAVVSPKNFLPMENPGMMNGIYLAGVACDESPIGIYDHYATGNDQSLSIAAPGFLVNDIDLAGEALTATALLETPDHGSLSAFPDGSFTYTPDDGFVGTDQFVYRMRDASFNLSDSVTVTIEVLEPGNRAPLGIDDAFGALSGTILSIAAPGFLANDIDQDGDVLTATALLETPDHGTLSAFPNGSFTYTPEPGFTGIDQFIYRMRDSEFNNSDSVTVIIQVFQGNRNPLGTDDHFGVVINTPLSIPAPGFLDMAENLPFQAFYSVSRGKHPQR